MRSLIDRIRKSSRHRSPALVGHDSKPTVDAVEYRRTPELQKVAEGSDRNGLHEVSSVLPEQDWEGTRYDIDVVAVHGLGGDLYKTWVYERDSKQNEETFWLSDLLPRDLPGARVFTFGYPSQWSSSYSVAGVKDYARSLLQALQQLSEKAKTYRPIIFICHSLGGIVVKQAIVTAWEDPRFNEIFLASRAVMFMGTPHRGSDIAKTAANLAAVANLPWVVPGLSFFATPIRTDLLKALIVGQHSALLGYPQEEKISLVASHMSMCRFSGFDDSNYKDVAGALQRSAIEIAKRVPPSARPTSGSDSAKPTPSLTESEIRYVTRYNTFSTVILDDRIEGTCAWTTRSIPYESWRKDPRSNVFWITGPAGTGKTILCSYLIDTLGTDSIRKAEEKISFNDQALVCGFFCVKDDQSRKDARAIIQGLLLQLFMQRKDILKKVKNRFGSSIQQLESSIDTLWRIFSFATRSAQCQTLYVIIDALDECEARSKKKLLDRIAETVQEWNEVDSALQRRVKFIITGDPQFLLSQKFVVESSKQYRLNIEDFWQDMVSDVERVVSKRVDDLVDRLFCTAQQGDKVKSSLCRHAENSFLWVTVMLNYIEQSLTFNAGMLEQILIDPPKDLNAAYSRYFPKISEQSMDPFKKLVHAMVACSRPLTQDELNIFITITNHPTIYAIEEDKQTHIGVVLKKAFGPMIKTLDSKVHFIHSSVKDFLLKLQGDPSHHLHATHAVDLQSAHLTLASACIRYLLLNDLRKDLFQNDSSSKSGEISLVSSEAQEIPPGESDLLFDMFSINEVDFLRDEDARHEAMLPMISGRFQAYEYAATYWAHHYAISEPIAETSLREKARLLCEEGSWQLSNWYTFQRSATYEVMPPLTEANPISVAAMFGHTRNLQELLEYQQYSDITLANILFWASCWDQPASVKVLLDHGVNPDVPKDQQTPLFAAAYAGLIEILRILIATKKVDINFKGRGGRTPLLVAAEQGHGDIVSLLLQQESIRVDNENHRGQTPFLAAASSGSLNCLNLLIGDGRIDIDHVDGSGRSALSLAAEEGFETIVKGLLKIQRIDLKSVDKCGRDALSYAAAKGQLLVVQYLVRSKLSIARGDNNGRNAISWASNSAKAVAKNYTGTSTLSYLIEKDRKSASTADNNGWTPLAWAMDPPGYIDAVRQLVEVGRVDVNQRDNTRGRPVLSWATAEGFVEIVEYLLTVPTIDENLTDGEGRTPSSYAASNGRLDIVKIFAKREHMDFRRPDSSGRTPLDWAIRCGKEEMVKELKAMERDGVFELT